MLPLSERKIEVVGRQFPTEQGLIEGDQLVLDVTGRYDVDIEVLERLRKHIGPRAERVSDVERADRSPKRRSNWRRSIASALLPAGNTMI